MRQDTLDRAVARVTGDDFAIIRRRGFSIVEASSALLDDDLAEIVRDWDRVQQEILDHDIRNPNWNKSIVRAPHMRNSNLRRQKRSRTANLGRSTRAAN